MVLKPQYWHLWCLFFVSRNLSTIDFFGCGISTLCLSIADQNTPTRFWAYSVSYIPLWACWSICVPSFFWLVVWNIFILCHILWTSSSQLTFIFFKGVSIPPTRYKQMVPKITPYMVPYITPFVYHHFCWLSPMICWTVTLDRHVTIPGLTRRSHRGLISEKIAREGFRNVKTEESNEDTQRISWNLSNVWLVFVYIYIYMGSWF